MTNYLEMSKCSCCGCTPTFCPCPIYGECAGKVAGMQHGIIGLQEEILEECLKCLRQFSEKGETEND